MTSAGGPSPDHDGQYEGRVIGRYLILDEIASGGMATVHLAHVEGDAERFVAVKCMHAHYARDPDFVSMFLDEAMLCTRIRHENVVATIDVSREHNELLLVLELVEGESLSRIVKGLSARKARVPQPIASAIVRDMLKGLHGAHEATNEAGEELMIVHRDVSPHNVLVGTDGVVKVLDFGVAKARGRVQQTQKGQLKGKLAYMSPEQARGRQVDRRSDVFSAGIVLWELLVGQRLFDGENEAALLVALLSEKPSAPSKRDPALAKYDDLVLKALSTNPDDRFATAEEMAAAVEAAITPATRAEVGAWVKNEARSSLARRQELIKRARDRVITLRGMADNESTAQDDVPTRAVHMDAAALEEARRAAASPSKGLQPPPRPKAGPARSPIAPARAAVPARAAAPAPLPGLPSTVAMKPAAPTNQDPILWDTSTTSDDDGQTLAMNAKDLGIGPPAVRAEAPSDPPTSVDLRDATLPLYQPPAAFLASVGIPTGPDASLSPLPPMVPPSQPAGAASVLQQPPNVATAVFPAENDTRAEAIPSQVTSVTLTTTDLPPPLAPEHVKRLKLIAVMSGAVGALAAIALLLVLTRKDPPPSKPAAPAASAVPVAVSTTPARSAAPATAEVVSAEAVGPSATVTASASAPPSAAPAPTAPPKPRGWPAPTTTYKPPTPKLTSKPTAKPPKR